MSMKDEMIRMFNLKVAGKCPRCEKDIKKEKYKDKGSKAEAKITGYCQACQDYIFDDCLGEDE